MKRTKAIVVALVVIIILGARLTGDAQPIIPKENIPADIPTDVRQQIERLYSSDPLERASAAFWLRKMGERALPAIPFLIAILPEYTEPHCSVVGCTHPSHAVFPGEKAAETLIAFGPHAVEPLISALKDKNLDIRRVAASILGNIKDPRAVGPLAAALNDENRNVRMMAAWSLAQIGTPSVEPLVAALRDRNSAARGDAAWALGKIKDPRAVEPLIEALKNEKPDIQQDAAKALEKITGEDFGVNPDKWQAWWEKNKGKKSDGG